MDYGESKKVTYKRITMLSYLEDIKDYDILWFMPAEKNENSIRIASNQYKNPGELTGGNHMGLFWHIVLFQNKNDAVEKLDHFEAILTDPREYISNLIPQGWYGFVAKKTTTSNEFVSDVLAKLKEI